MWLGIKYPADFKTFINALLTTFWTNSSSCELYQTVSMQEDTRSEGN